MRTRTSFGVLTTLGLIASGFLTTASQATAAPTVYYSCGYTMEAADGSKTISGCTKGAVEGSSPVGMLDRCLGKTKDKDGLVEGLDCCTAARRDNKDLAAKHAKIEVNVRMISNKEVEGPSGVCK